ncbi:MAG: ATP-binding cassette domain-containing protein, partial [Pseudolabrys sp.]
MASSLTIEGVHAAYGAVRVIEDVSIAVKPGETVALLGTNGNGKSTLMKCVMGIVRPKDGSIIAEIDGEKHELVGRTTEQIVDLGIALVPEGRRLFPKLTVEENLLLGAFRPKARSEIKANLNFCFESFPRLAERRRQLAGSMSGGEQQMLAL